MTMKNKNFRSMGFCVVCSKQMYGDRKSAKAACRQHQGEHKTPFRCPDQSMFWHIGGLSKAVIAGEFSRDDIYSSAA